MTVDQKAHTRKEGGLLDKRVFLYFMGGHTWVELCSVAVLCIREEDTSCWVPFWKSMESTLAVGRSWPGQKPLLWNTRWDWINGGCSIFKWTSHNADRTNGCEHQSNCHLWKWSKTRLSWWMVTTALLYLRELSMPDNHKLAEQHALSLKRKFERVAPFHVDCVAFMHDIICCG